MGCQLQEEEKTPPARARLGQDWQRLCAGPRKAGPGSDYGPGGGACAEVGGT